MKDLTILCDYKNRQVILNYYYEDELISRDGTDFDSIYVHQGTVYFIKHKKQVLTINPRNYCQTLIGEEFQNYYIMRRDQDRLEIYIP